MSGRVENHSLQAHYRSYISGCHILHHHGVVDAYGHLSFRHPDKPDIFVMSRYIAPGTISSPNDLIEYRVDNAEPVDPNAPKGYSELIFKGGIGKLLQPVVSICYAVTNEKHVPRESW